MKSNIGHLKGAAGAAGLLKAVMALHDKVLPPSLNFERPNPNIDFGRVAVRGQHRAAAMGRRRRRRSARAGVSAFGFGGTNFHAVLEEHVPGRRDGNGAAGVVRRRRRRSQADRGGAGRRGGRAGAGKAPLRGAFVVGAADDAGARRRGCARSPSRGAPGGRPPPAPPAPADLARRERVAIDYGDAAELADKAGRAREGARDRQRRRCGARCAARASSAAAGRPGKVAFLYTGQGSQYVEHADEPARAGADRRRHLRRGRPR